MNISEFAHRVVFGTTLEEKLNPPGRLTNDADRRSLHLSTRTMANLSPGRPYGLAMQTDRNSIPPPSDDQLENENARGQLLHYLANHELLATELMALVLLKFPDAPSAFRRGVLVTLQEEQQHTQMYLDRMAECGVEFGTYPVSGQFWRLIEPMQSPMEFVSRLSLTFEQANLDYSLHFASVFDRIGDKDTAEILHQIYTDEISHVQHGLHWFRQWKEPEQSDWEAYQASLDFPMSPQRGRGPRAAFNRAGRVQAGLTDDFIDAIEVYRQSRGRPPNVYWFDAAAEQTLAKNPSAADFRLTNQIQCDLQWVVAAMAKEDDIVIVDRLPSKRWRKQIVDASMELPQFLTFDQLDSLNGRKLGALMPWAWTPKSHRTAAPMSHATQTPSPMWHTNQRELFSKSFSTNLLRHWLVQGLSDPSCSDDFVGLKSVGHVATDRFEVEQAKELIFQNGFSVAIVKHDLSASGRNQRTLDCRSPLSAGDEKWLDAIFNRQEVVVVEPELDRVADLSFLWRYDDQNETPKFLGWTRPLITTGRRYSGTKFGNVFGDCSTDVKRFLLANKAVRIHSVAQWLQPRIAAQLKSRNFRGYFGVDALVCRTGEKTDGGRLQIKPLVELNPRMTMGHIALNLSRHVATGVASEFRLFNRKQFHAIKDSLAKIPIQLAGDRRWKSGVIYLSQPDEKTKLFPVMLVGTDAVEIAASLG